ncbi:low affinity iron permease family protein [Streptomyces sp. NPDC006290]|uniref:low affinity iron permease family protein n=1 Tax=Streptomyces sp. NPDC006290 TaxID=3156745 RepID=UPI0033B527BB
MTFQHPADRGGDERGRFERLAESGSRFTSSPVFFAFCVGLVSLAVAAHVAGLAVQWLLLVGEAMTAVTLLLLALLKNSELRSERAIQRKLDAIAAALLEAQEGAPGKAHEDLRRVIRMEDETWRTHDPAAHVPPSRAVPALSVPVGSCGPRLPRAA